MSHICMDRTVVQETTIKSPLMAHTRLENIYENNQNIFKNSFASKLLKGVFAKNERGYRLNAIKKRF